MGIWGRRGLAKQSIPALRTLTASTHACWRCSAYPCAVALSSGSLSFHLLADEGLFRDWFKRWSRIDNGTEWRGWSQSVAWEQRVGRSECGFERQRCDEVQGNRADRTFGYRIVRLKQMERRMERYGLTRRCWTDSAASAAMPMGPPTDRSTRLIIPKAWVLINACPSRVDSPRAERSRRSGVLFFETD